MSETYGVLMLNMGGPDDPAKVEQFLTSVLEDEDIIRLPAQRLSARAMARMATKKWQRKYEALGGASPLLYWAERQRYALQEDLNALHGQTGLTFLVENCFRYSEPDTTMALTRLAERGVSEVIALTQYPQYSCTTTLSSVHEISRVLARDPRLASMHVSYIDRFGSHPNFIDALAGSVREALDSLDSTGDDRAVVYCAHTLPKKIVDRGDDYLQEVTETVGLLNRELDLSIPTVLCFQEAKSGDQGPDAERVIRSLADQGFRSLVVVAPAFVCDHEETLWEIDVELAEIAADAGIEQFVRARALNLDPTYLECLCNLVLDHLHADRRPHPKSALRCAGCTTSDCREVRPSSPTMLTRVTRQEASA